MSKATAIHLLLTFVLLLLSGCGTSKTQSSFAPDPTGNWVMAAKDAHGASFQLSGVLQSIDTSANVMATPNVIMVNALGSTQQASASCFPYRVALGNGNQNGTAFTGVFNVIAKTGEAVDLHVTATLASDGTSMSSGTYSLAGTASSCFPAAQSGAFTGAQVANVSGKWSGTIQPCNFDPSTSTCTVTGQAATVTANLNQDNVKASVNATYSVSSSATFSTGMVNQLSDGLLSGQTWRATWMDNNGARFTMNSQIGQNGTLSGTLTDGFSNYYLLKLSH